MNPDLTSMQVCLARLDGLQPAAARQTAGDSLFIWDGIAFFVGILPSELATHPLHDLELAPLWPAPSGSADQGMGLLVGGEATLLTRAGPVLDRLAVQPGGWLYCGPSGAAAFCQRVFHALFYLTGPALFDPLHPRPDWETLQARQQHVARHLQSLCQHYLERYAVANPIAQSPDEAWQAWLALRAGHPHYALILATMLWHTLQLNDQAQTALQQLLQHAAAMQKAR